MAVSGQHDKDKKRRQREQVGELVRTVRPIFNLSNNYNYYIIKTILLYTILEAEREQVGELVRMVRPRTVMHYK